MRQELAKLDPEIIEHFRRTGESEAIGDKLQKYIMHLDRVPELYRHDSNISRCARKLKDFFPNDNISFNTARQIIYDAINMFHLNNTVKNEAWDQMYADKLDDLARVNIAKGSMKEARLNFVAAHRLRTLRDESQIDEELLKPPTYIITNDIDIVDLGFKKKNLKQIQRKAKDGHYAKLIDSLNIEKEEKDRLKRDANIEDVEFEELDSGN